MKTIQTTERSLEDLATNAVTLGRAAHDAALRVNAGRTSRKAAFVARALQRVGDRKPFDRRDCGSLDEVRRIIEADVEAEILGVDVRFVEVGCDADGPVLAAQNMPVYSERGEKLVDVLALFDQFVEARAETLDRIAAERALRNLFAS